MLAGCTEAVRKKPALEKNKQKLSDPKVLLLSSKTELYRLVRTDELRDSETHTKLHFGALLRTGNV